MQCVGCGSAAVSERTERTVHGYRRFRCCACGKQFNERSGGLLNRTQYPSDVIALVVLWRLRYKAQTQHSVVGVDGPRRHRRAKMRSLLISDQGDYPCNRLAELEWIRRSMCFSFMG